MPVDSSMSLGQPESEPLQPPQKPHHPLNKPLPRPPILNLMPRPRNKPRKLTHHPLPTSLDPPPHQPLPIHRPRHQLILPRGQYQQRFIHKSKRPRKLGVRQVRREEVIVTPAKTLSVSHYPPRRQEKKEVTHPSSASDHHRYADTGASPKTDGIKARGIDSCSLPAAIMWRARRRLSARVTGVMMSGANSRSETGETSM